MPSAMTIRIPSAEEQLTVLERGTVDIHPRDVLVKKLQHSHETQKPLIIKTGFDPTAPDLHLGHTVLIEKMAQFQRFGHDVVFLVGDYTALIGDPTGRNTARPPLTEDQIRANASTYTEQCFKILDRTRTRIEWNSSWLGKLTFNDTILLTSRYNLGRMLERRDFRQRFEHNQQICLHEFLYPLMQGYDSVMLKADIELGGHDQIFNLYVGRHLMESYGLEAQAVLTVGLLVGLDGLDKMSKSKGNHIGITEPPDDMFGKVMSVSDELMQKWFPLLLGNELERNADPLAEKKRLAKAMVARFHGSVPAEDTFSWWEAGRPPRNVAEVRVTKGPLFSVVHKAGGATSGSDARRKIQQGGVTLNGERFTDPVLEVASGSYLLEVGKKWAAKITVE